MEHDKTAFPPWAESAVTETDQHDSTEPGSRAPDADPRWPATESEDVVSFHQERILFIDRFEAGKLYPGAPTYHNALKILDVEGGVSNAQLQVAAQSLVQRHGIFRTSLPYMERGFRAVVAPEGYLEEVTVRQVQCRNRDDAISRAIESADEPFQVQRGPLLRFALINYEPNRFLICIGAHHVVADKSTMDLLARELVDLYHGAESPDGAPESRALTFAQFAGRQRRAFAEGLEEAKFYWRSKLHSDALPVLDFPTDHTREAVQVYSPARHSFDLGVSIAGQAAALALEMGCEVRDVFLTAFICLAYRHAKQRTGIVGISAANRENALTRRLLGPVAKLLPILTELPEDFTFRRALARVTRACREATAFGAVPFERIVDLASPAKDMSRTALFDLLFQYEETVPWSTTSSGWRIQEVETNLGWGKYDLNLLLSRDGVSVHGCLAYNRRYFKASSIERLVDAYGATLQRALLRPDAPLTKTVVSGESERKLVAGWEYSPPLPVHPNPPNSLAECFEATCDRFGERTALTAFDAKGAAVDFTYAELDKRANQLAHVLKNRFDIKPGNLVGLFLRDALEVVVGILAVLKTGAAYVPLDPDSPPVRLERICGDCGLPCIVTTKSIRERVESLASVVCIDAGDVQTMVDHRLRIEATPGDLAYVIYTSGSTGVPKGVLIENRAVLTLFAGSAFEYRFDEHDVWTLFHSYAFDVSVWEIWGAFLHGGKLVAVPHFTRRDPVAFKKLLLAEKTTVLSQTPAAFYQLLNAATDDELAALKASLHYVVCCGERLDFSNLLRWFAASAERALIVNMYGITETTVHTTFHVVELPQQAADISKSIIGKPLRGGSLRIVDREGAPEPVGVTGEIQVGGPQLARGYLNQPELTHERFLYDAERNGERWYRSGDFGRWNADGLVEYKGRGDAQIQLRGFRVEIGEIESALRTCSGLKQSTVKVRSGEAGLEILAYCVFDGQRPALTAVRSELLRSLPEYMVPSRFVVLDQMPLTINGKVDWRALPAPDPDNVLSDGVQKTSDDAIELTVLASIRRVLKNEKIGPTSDFFASGGHSLMAISLVGEIEKAVGARLDLAAVFELRTARGIAGRVRTLGTTRSETMPLAEERKYYPLSSFQKQVYIEHVLNPASCQFNMPFALHFEGALEVDRFRTAVAFLMARREILRTRFVIKQSQPFQQILPPPALDFEYRQDHHFVLPDGLVGLIKPFDLERPPLLRTVLIETGTDRHVLFVDVHHIAFDLFSFPLLVDDLIAGYRGAKIEEGRRREYRDFATWEAQRMEAAETENLYCYWMGKLADAPPSPQLPGFLKGERRPGVNAGNIDFKLEGELFRAARACLQGRGVTPYVFFLAAFKVALALRTNAHDIVVGSDDANRDALETRDIMGFFINQIVLRSRINLQLTFEEQLTRVAEEVEASLRHKSLPFYRIVERLNPARQPGRNPLFQVKFDFLPNWKFDREILWKVTPVKLPVTMSKNDLHLFVTETDDAFACSLHFDEALYRSSTVTEFMRIYHDLLSEIIKKPGVSMKELNTNTLGGETPAEAGVNAAGAGGLRGFRRQKTNVQPAALFDERVPESRTLPLIMKASLDDVDLETWVPSHREQLFEKLRRHGAILFRGCRVNSIERFERVVKAICPDMIREYGDLPAVSEGARVYASTPYPPDKKILFHNESSHLPSWPRHQFFACLKPAERGGETPIVDCREVYRRLDPSVRDLFERKGLMYIRTFVRGFDVSWQDFFKTNDQEEVRAFCTRNQMECEWIDGVGLQTRSRSPAVLRHPATGELSFFNQIQLHHAAFLEEEVRRGMQSVLNPSHFPRNVLFGDGTPIDDALALATYQVYRECEVALPWERGDLIMVDNLLVAHARNEYEGSRSIIVALADLMQAPAEAVATT